MIETERLVLRKYKDSDAKNLYLMISETPAHYKYTRIPYPYKLKDAKEFIRKCKLEYRKKSDLPLLVTDKQTGKIIGTIVIRELNSPDKKAEMGYTLARSATGKGFITEAAEAFVDYAFKKLKLNRVEICCATKNPASRRVIRRLHADYEGISRQALILRGKFHDEHRYALLKKEWKRKVLYKVK